jgi:hypothetical protein
VIPDPDVAMLAEDIGHRPQLEARDAVLTHFFRRRALKIPLSRGWKAADIDGGTVLVKCRD